MFPTNLEQRMLLCLGWVCWSLVLCPVRALAGRCYPDGSGVYLCKGGLYYGDNKPIEIRAEDGDVEVRVSPGFKLQNLETTGLVLKSEKGSVRYAEEPSPGIKNDDIEILSWGADIEVSALEDIDFTTRANLSSYLINIETFNNGSGTMNLKIGGTLKTYKNGSVGNVLTQSAGGRHLVSLLPTAELSGSGYGVVQAHGVNVKGETIGSTAGGDTIAYIDGVVRLGDDDGHSSGSLHAGEADVTVGRAYFINTGRETAEVTVAGAGTLEGNRSGLAIHHRGEGDISVDFSGKITARYGDAIDIVAETPAVRTNLTFSGAIRGGRDGIALDSPGDATIAIGGDLKGRRYAIHDGGGNTTVCIGNTTACIEKPDNGVDKIHVAGDIALGGGDDVLAFDDSVVFDRVAVLDGGAGEKDRLSIGTHLIGSTSSAGNPNGEQIQIKNWETVDIIGSGGGLTLNGDLDAADIDNAGRLGLSPETPSARLIGNLTNRGEVRLDGNPSPGQRLTVEGDYHGQGGKVWLNTVWNAPGGDHGADSRSDVLEIVGRADGRTEVVSITEDGRENIIDGDVVQVERMLDTVPVVTVAGESAADAFSGRARTTGATEVQLMRTVGFDGATNYRWTMYANPKQADPSSAVDAPVSGYVQAESSDPPETGALIYAPSVSGYVQMASVDRELLYSTLGRMQVRGRKGAWGQIAGKHLDLDGKKRFAQRGDQTLLWIGKDFGLSGRSKNGSYRHGGVYLSYGRANTRFSDDKRAVDGVISGDKRTGAGTTYAASLGGYATIQSENGGHLDVRGAFSYLRNGFAARASATVRQNGYGAALSAQVGRALPVTSGWTLEPQARVSYQTLRLDDLHDGTKEVKFPPARGLVARLGMRLDYRPTAEFFYLDAGLAHEFIEPKTVAIGADKVRESYADTWGEVGVGARLPLSHSGYLHGEIAYECGFGMARREGFRGMAGLRYFLD